MPSSRQKSRVTSATARGSAEAGAPRALRVMRAGVETGTGWDDVDELELATLSWVHWFNENRLHRHCQDTPPAEFEAAFYAAQRADPAGVGSQ